MRKYDAETSEKHFLKVLMKIRYALKLNRVDRNTPFICFKNKIKVLSEFERKVDVTTKSASVSCSRTRMHFKSQFKRLNVSAAVALFCDLPKYNPKKVLTSHVEKKTGQATKKYTLRKSR